MLETLTTRMAIRVEDQKGQLRCDASGFPAGKGQEQAFVTSTPVHAAGIWLMGCNDFSVKNCNPCSLTVTISNVAPHTPAIPIVPSIEGGGIELP